MGVDFGALQTLETKFQTAPFTPGGWDDALKALASATKSARGQILAVGGPNHVPFNWITDTPQSAIDDTQTLGLYTPDVNWRIAAGGAPLELIAEDEYRAAAENIRSDIYDDFSEWFGCQFGCQTILQSDASSLIGLAVLRTRKDGETSADDRALFAAVAPHALNAVRMQAAMRHQGAKLVAGAFEAMNAAAFVCDRLGRILALTSAAEAALRDRAVLTLRGQHLSAARPQDDLAFQRALAGVLADTTASDPIWLEPASASGGGRICEIFALPRQEWGMGFEPRAIVILSAPAEVAAHRRNLLRQAFSLTEAESEIAAMAASGLPREEIAFARSASLHTINSQFKSIFTKMDVRREAEMVALINWMLR